MTGFETIMKLPSFYNVGLSSDSPGPDPARPECQRKAYGKGFYRNMRRLRWLLRYDCRYRLFLMEQAFRRNRISFEHQKVYELGFGTGNLLMRFDASCILHGCEISAEAVRVLRQEPRLARHKEVTLLEPDGQGNPIFPAADYDIAIASHVLEHVPDDIATLRKLYEHTNENGFGFFFVPLERPSRQNPLHVRTYTAAGFCELLDQTGWTPIEVRENLRFDTHWEKGLELVERLKLAHLPSVFEAIKNVMLSLAPTGLMRISEGPLESLYVSPRQLMVLARKKK
jgi:SAM-dependent methyltransferase